MKTGLPRLRLPFLIVFCALFGLAGRIFYIQVLRGMAYVELAERQFVRKVKTELHRGEILDRDGALLATTIESQSLFMDPKELKKSKDGSRFLLAKMGWNQAQLKSKVDSGDRFVWLERKLNPGDAKLAIDKPIPGVGVMSEQTRYYPNGPLACHLIGAVGLDNRGLSGVEQALDSFLTGSSFVTRQLRDGKGRRIVTGQARRDAALQGPSKSIVLTINRSLQYVAEKEIERAVCEQRAESGMIVMQNPATGEVLAMAAYPAFDPNVFSKGKSPHDLSRKILNPLVGKMFEPGSTFKVVTFAAALEEKKGDPDELINCEDGKWKFKGVTINDHEPHSSLTFSQVLEKSSNIGSAKLGLRLGKETLYRYARAFGFGTKTGVQLPGESAGLMRQPASWSPVSLPIVSFGQEIGVTAIQLITAFSAIANGGTLMEPMVIRQLKELRNGKVVSTHFSPQVVRRVVSEGTTVALRKMLQDVTEKGTGSMAKIPGYTVAGKTGTAQKIDPATRKYSNSKYVASFCGFVPAQNPKVVCFVLLDEPKRDYWGGSTAAPVFASVMARAVQILGIAPDAPEPAIVAKAVRSPLAPARTVEKEF